MYLGWSRWKDFVASSDIFRIASLSLYATLLLHAGLSVATGTLKTSPVSIAALNLVLILLLVSLFRLFKPEIVRIGKLQSTLEMTMAVSAVLILSAPNVMSPQPLAWLIAIAGVFPLALPAVTGSLLAILVAATAIAVSTALGLDFDHWMPLAFGILFAGALAVLLSKAIHINVKAIEQARINDRRFETMSRAARHVFMIMDRDFKLKLANPALSDVIGFSQEEFSAIDFRPHIHPDDNQEHNRKMTYLRDTPFSNIFLRHRARHKNGHWVWLETSGYNLLHDPAINGLVFSIEDVTARKDVELKLEQEHSLLRAVLDLNPSMIYAKDKEGRYTISNRSYQKRFGYESEEDLRGKTSYELFLQKAIRGQEMLAYEIADALHLQDMHVIESGEALEDLEVQGLQEREGRRWYRTNKYPLLDASGATAGVLGITRDVTDRKEYELRLQHQASHDPLTSLPNRRYLLATISDAIAAGRGATGRTFILFCDLDFFKSVNDTHGHDFGDQCLMAITKRLQTEIGPRDFAARFGGNQFMVLTEGQEPEILGKAQLLLHTVSEQLLIGNTLIKLQTSIGVARLTEYHKTPSDLIRDADAALYQAKELGRNRVEVYDASLQHLTMKRAQLDVALRFALERNELKLVYQPKVSLIDGTLKGFEVLLRWDSPDYGIIPPNEFIPIAESSGMVLPIGLWVLEQACRQLANWQMNISSSEGLTIAVNVSMRQLFQANFLPEVTRIVSESGIEPGSLELEITETSAMANPEQTIENLTQLKKLGLRLALDDFGTGYSSLSYLQRLPIDVLKIDQSFIHGLVEDSGDSEIVRLILALAQTLNLETVAEGVEAHEHMTELKKLGCYLGQGYIFSPPLTPPEAEELICSSQRFLVALT